MGISRKQYAARIAQGLCIRCRAPTRAGCVECQPCADKQIAARNARRPAGTCRCGAAVLPAGKTCESCRDQDRLRVAARDAERRVAGLCRSCPAPALPGGVTCASCRDKATDAVRARKTGFTPDEYRAALREQNGRCAACGDAPSPGVALQADHCHTTHKKRGLLCGRCNRALGLLKDDPERIRRLLAYLTR